MAGDVQPHGPRRRSGVRRRAGRGVGIAQARRPLPRAAGGDCTALSAAPAAHGRTARCRVAVAERGIRIPARPGEVRSLLAVSSQGNG